MRLIPFCAPRGKSAVRACALCAALDILHVLYIGKLIQGCLAACTALPCTALPCPALHCTALHCAALPCPALPCTALPCPALHCTALPCTALHCTALHRPRRAAPRCQQCTLSPVLSGADTGTPTYNRLYTALHFTALHCIALHCTA
jgi:hypothetical protein